MNKRMLDCRASDFRAMDSRGLLEAIAGSEGRTLACETIGAAMPLLGDVSNAELAAAMGADILLLNLFDAQKPVLYGLPDTAPDELIRELKRLTGRPVAVNLEPAEPPAHPTELWALTEGRRATLANAQKLADMGADMLLLTGNPGVGVGNRAITAALREIRAGLGGRLVLAAGKMHASGILGEGGAQIMTEQDADEFAEAGADILLLPAPGTVGGITMESARALISHIHARGKLAMTAIGTSQEGADTATIREIALLCKMAGADIHHLGDSGYFGIAVPENILAYSTVIRGVRHTYRRMAASVNR